MALVCSGALGEAPEKPPSEYQVRAAFLYNFVKFVEWPGSPNDQGGAIELCVLGKDPVEGELQRVISGKTVSGRSLTVRRISDPAAAQSCRILFVSSSEAGRVPEVLKALGSTGVLTVSEAERFSEHGGMINFRMEGQRVRFQINAAAANRVGLKISSQLLQLAVTPDDKRRD